MATARGFAARWGLDRPTLTAARELVAGLARETAGTTVTPPARSSYAQVSASAALGLGTVYRALTIHATAVSQLSLVASRAGRKLEQADTPALVRQPDPACSLSSFLEDTTVSLAADGNAFWRIFRADPADPISVPRVARVIPPQLVTVNVDHDTGALVYDVAAMAGRAPERLRAHEMRHLKLLRIPGALRGLGPIQAAQTELRGALQLRDYSSLWFDTSEGAAVPNGVLTTDQPLTATQAGAYKEAWLADKGHNIRVLGNGLKFAPNVLSPADAQFLESRQFTTTELARLFGIPASLMLAVVDGSSQSYANVEQDWIAYVRFSLMQYLKEIEDALSELLPRGLSATFDTGQLLRSDTKTRFEAHSVGLAAGILTPNEARAAEGLPPLAGGDQLRITTTPTPKDGTP